MHDLLGRLRGQTAPPDAVLDRLRDLMGPRVRLHWAPAYDGRGGVWVLAERVGEPGYRACGAAILERYRRAGQPVPVEIGLGVEMMLDGDHVVATYDATRFGTDWMFQDLAKHEREARAMKQAIFSAQRASERRAIEAEQAQNPAFAAAWFAREHPEANAAVDALTDDVYDRYHLSGAVSVPVATSLEAQ